MSRLTDLNGHISVGLYAPLLLSGGGELAARCPDGVGAGPDEKQRVRCRCCCAIACRHRGRWVGEENLEPRTVGNAARLSRREAGTAAAIITFYKTSESTPTPPLAVSAPGLPQSLRRVRSGYRDLAWALRRVCRLRRVRRCRAGLRLGGEASRCILSSARGLAEQAAP